MATNDTQNNASQTLFRFVSLRNPQLTETKTKNLGFIHRPSTLSSSFDAAINPGDTALLKFQALERAAKSFNTTGYESENQIEAGSLSEALKIGRKIAKKEVLSPIDENTAKNLSNSSPIQSRIGQVWDNLIYQTVTQKNFYVKEALIHILKAIHYGYVADLPLIPELVKINGDDLKAKALEARVVLPMKFFGDGYEGEGPTSNPSGNAFQVNVSKIGDGVISGTSLSVAEKEQLKNEGQRISELSYLSFEKDGLIQLRTELESVQKTFNNLRAKAYAAAHKSYLEANQENIQKYNELSESIKEQIAQGGLTKEQIDALYASLERIKVPPFIFEYKNEINFGDMKDKLSLNSFKLFVNIFTKVTSGEKPQDGFDFSRITVLTDKTLQLGNVVVSITEEFDTYPEIYEKLDEETSTTTQALFEKTPLQEKTYASIGGVLVPIVDSYSAAARIVSKSYYLKTSYEPIHSRMPATATFYYQAESNAWGAASVKVSASTDFGLYEESFSNIDVVDNKVTLPLFLIDKFGKFIRSLEIKIYFNNGKEASLQLSELAINQPFTGILYTEETKDDTEGPSEGGTSQPGVFIPKHFGVKRLGIADYLKVEQSVHAYVPGEVSNIENVMASELRHKSSVARDYSEITDTVSESIETEKISDTSKAERAEMQTEVAKELEKQQSFTGSTHFGYSGGYTLDISAGYANNTAQHDSTRQAVAKSQEITERAMERVLTKVNKERVQKIIKEFTETNVHEFDNRGSKTGTTPQHITGVYRWVDKKMKNQIYNYGKRTMFEFMVPEPARLHTLAANTSRANTLVPPIDPRASKDEWEMLTPQKATKLQIEFWANYYNVKLTEQPKSPINIVLGKVWEKIDGNEEYRHRQIDIPDNYEASAVKMFYGFEKNGRGANILHVNNFAGTMIPLANNTGGPSIDSVAYFTPQNVTGSYDFVYRCQNIDSVNIAFEITCKLSAAYLQSWFLENFKAIIKAYDEAYAIFLEKQKEFEDKAKEEEEKNREKLNSNNFYRDMESVILKHNCIAYLLQDYGALGVNFTNGAKRMQDFSIVLSENLEQYTALAKFMEQAFEWSIMDYTFYPYYWGNRAKWQEMYLSQSTDPLFRSFLQAGMARVVVTVKPGFEDAVQFFMSTGKIWNGGEVPVIGDPLYMSIVDELRQPTGVAQGKYWITRIPTTLTILQAESVGLKVSPSQPLPIFREDNPENCENPKELESTTSFSLDNATLKGADEKTTTLPTTIVG